jgi:hypothetical protein
LSTVLWANHLLNNGEVASDESDKWALFKHADKLDKLASVVGLEPFSSLLDHTDMQFNIGDDELPEGIQSTTELMARNGVWKSADNALTILNGLLAVITTEKPRFGVMKNDYDAVVAELSESIEYAKKVRELGVKFNFSVVM